MVGCDVIRSVEEIYMSLPDFNNYKYIMFVDASGDDGYKFKENSNDGSSFSFVVSCFMTTPADFDYNKSVLIDMKKAMFVKPEQEIKSTALRRNRNANKVYEKLLNLKGICFSLIVDKKLVQNCQPDPNNQFYKLTQTAHDDLSGITHSFPYMALAYSGLIDEDDKILIVIDNMKKREMDSIKQMLQDEFPNGNYYLIFRDSKDKDFSLIQIADIMAGTIRNYYESCLPIKDHNRYCSLCSHALVKLKVKAGFPTMACKMPKYKKLFTPYITNSHFNIVMNFHRSKIDKGAGSYFSIIPIEQLFYFMYIDCLIIKE